MKKFVLLLSILSTVVYGVNDQAMINALTYRTLELGPLGVTGRTQYGTNHILVSAVESGFSASLSGLQRNDVILGTKVNDTESDVTNFTPELEGDINGGAGPREEIGNAIDDALATSSRKLTLRVHRNATFQFYQLGGTNKFNAIGGQIIDLVVTLPDMPSLKASWPFNSATTDSTKAMEVTDELCDYLAELVIKEQQISNNHYKPTITYGAWGLSALISSGKPKYHNAIKFIADNLIDRYSDDNYETYGTAGWSTWTISAVGYGLCEYYAATGDDRAVLPIKNIMRIISRTTPVKTPTRGMHGHGYRQDGGYAYFREETRIAAEDDWNAGLNAVSTTLYTVMTFAHYHLGISLDSSAIEEARYTDTDYSDDALWSYDTEKTIGAMRYHLGRSLGKSSIIVNGKSVDSWHTGYYAGQSEWDAGSRSPQHAAGLIFESSTWLNKDFSSYPDEDGDGNLDSTSRIDTTGNNLMERRVGAIRYSCLKPGMSMACH